MQYSNPFYQLDTGVHFDLTYSSYFTITLGDPFFFSFIIYCSFSMIFLTSWHLEPFLAKTSSSVPTLLSTRSYKFSEYFCQILVNWFFFLIIFPLVGDFLLKWSENLMILSHKLKKHTSFPSILNLFPEFSPIKIYWNDLHHKIDLGTKMSKDISFEFQKIWHCAKIYWTSSYLTLFKQERHMTQWQHAYHQTLTSWFTIKVANLKNKMKSVTLFSRLISYSQNWSHTYVL